MRWKSGIVMVVLCQFTLAGAAHATDVFITGWAEIVNLRAEWTGMAYNYNNRRTPCAGEITTFGDTGSNTAVMDASEPDATQYNGYTGYFKRGSVLCFDVGGLATLDSSHAYGICSMSGIPIEHQFQHVSFDWVTSWDVGYVREYGWYDTGPYMRLDLCDHGYWGVATEPPIWSVSAGSLEHGGHVDMYLPKFDDICFRVVAVSPLVPEPSSMSAIVVGLIGLGGAVRTMSSRLRLRL